MDGLKYIRNLPIRSKLTLLLLVPCVIVLLLAGAGMLWFQSSNFKQDFARDLKAAAQIVAKSITAATAFNDREAAGEMLKTLEVKSHVISAVLVLPNRDIFARYGTDAAAPLPGERPGVRGLLFEGDKVLVIEPVILEQEQIGTIRVLSDYGSVSKSLWRMGADMFALVLGIAVLVAIFLSGRLQSFVSAPIQRLAQTAAQIAEKNDYSVRAREERDAEFGLLTRTFNQMLARIQAQDAALTLSQNKLEALIHSIDGIVWECNPEDFHFTFLSRQCERLLGYSPRQWLEDPNFWQAHLHPEDAANALKKCHEYVAKRQPYSYEYRMIAADDRVVWIRESGVVLVEHDKPVAVRGIYLDITAQKQATEQFEKLNQQLLETSRRAGMAEVATGVLHNVGNVLNSVNVSTTMLKELLNKTRSPGVNRIGSLMRENTAELGPFLTSHPKGRLIPEFLTSLATQMEGDRVRLLREVEQLGKNIEHIKEIVAMQQSYARIAGMTEDLPIRTLIDDALRIQEGGLARRGVTVRCNFNEVPLVRVDKHKVMQILLNLFRNAEHAMDATGRLEKILTISTSWNGNGKVKVDVNDNGVGIPEENLTRIFQHGFTTKKEGHGFGLHSGANAAREMGGALYASSPGPGSGAVFTLELPAAEAIKIS